MTRSRRSARGRARARARARALVLLGVGGLLGLLTFAGLSPAAAVGESEPAPEYTRTKTLTREHLEPDGTATLVEQREVTVTVDHTQSLRGRERVEVTWSGAHPSAGRTNSPYANKGLNQEYPVVILQCRGVDDPSLPVAQQLRPQTCWTTTYLQRAMTASPASAWWRFDRYADEQDVAGQDAVEDWPQECGRIPQSILWQHLLPFVAENGTEYHSCNEQTIAPESSYESALPPAELASFTRADGSGEAQFEIRTETENESLGCSVDVPCSLVVIPIMGISCATTNPSCRAENSLPTGSSNAVDDGGQVNDAVSTKSWWSESNWRGRFAVPLTFALPPDACDVLDNRAPVEMFGSEVLNQASLQWAPAYCLRADRFKFRHNRMSEPVALRLLATGEGAAAFVSEPAETTTVPLGYAPIAVSGFAIAFVADLPDNAGEVEQIRLTPRLLAKLLTQSYPASTNGRTHPGLEKNPISIVTDPEFVELNPSLVARLHEAEATLLSLSESSDVMTAMTSYIAGDPEAMAFIAGEADPWGMVVNPFYKDVVVPRAEWPLLDTWPGHAGGCATTTPYLARVAAPVGSLRKIAEAVLDSWPNSQTKCIPAIGVTSPEKLTRVERQSYGTRFMLGLVSLGDAERFGLRTAELRTDGEGTGAAFVGPSAAGMSAALAAASQKAPGDPFRIDRAALAADAYPGTMIVHATARLAGLRPADAGKVAQLIRTATTEGQAPGSGNGQLAAGYLPIEETGSTAALFASAQVVAGAIAAQQGPIKPPVTASPAPQAPAPVVTSSSSVDPAAGALGAPSGSLPVAGSAAPEGEPASVQGLPAPEEAAGAAPGPAPVTQAQGTGTAPAVIPAALGLSLAGGIGAPALWAWSTRRRAL